MVNRQRVLEALEHLLLTAVSVLVAVILITAFMRVIATPDREVTATGVQAAGATSESAVTTTTEAPRLVVAASPVTTTTAAPASCQRDNPTASEGQMVFRIFYRCGSSRLPTAATWVYRTVPTTTAVLTTTMRMLVNGPSGSERADGFRSVFSSATSDSVISVTLSSGATVVNFAPFGELPELRDPTQQLFALADMYASLFQYERVDTVEFRIQNDCEAFWAALNKFGCRVITRADWDAALSGYRAGT